MVVVAQLVRAPDCGSGGRRFEPDLPPSLKPEVIQAFSFSLYQERYFESSRYK